MKAKDLKLLVSKKNANNKATIDGQEGKELDGLTIDKGDELTYILGTIEWNGEQAAEFICNLYYKEALAASKPSIIQNK